MREDLLEPDPLLSEAEPSVGHLSEYWDRLVRRRGIVAAAVLAGLAGAAVVSVFSRPVYRATALLDLGEDREVDAGPPRADAKSKSPDLDYVATQIRLIRSGQVAERVVRQLDLAHDPEFDRSSSARANAPVTDARVAHLAARVRGGIEVEPVKGTDLVEVSSLDSSPRLAAEIANATAAAYLRWDIDSRNAIASEVSASLAPQIAQLKGELGAGQQKLLAAGSSSDVVSTDALTSGSLQNLDALNREYETAVGDRVAREARYRSLLGSGAAASADPVAAVQLAQAQNDVSRMEADYAEKLNLYKPEWPAMQELRSRIDKAKQQQRITVSQTAAQSREAARSDLVMAQRREASLQTALQAKKGEAARGSKNAIEYNNMRSEVDSKRALLEALLKRQAEAEVRLQPTDARSSIRIVDPARPPSSRYRPSYSFNALVGILLGGGLGLCLVFFLEYMDRSVRSPDHVERYLHLPTLGIVPETGAARPRSLLPNVLVKDFEGPERTQSVELLPHRDPQSAAAEAYRRIRTSLLLSDIGEVHSILVTSAFSKEGKTCTAANIAVIMSQLGKRVLLIDADLHHPRLHELFGTHNRPGLVSVLADGVDPSDVVVRTSVEGVFLLPSGPRSANPSALLSSGAMTRLMEAANASFDLVILDSPPIFPMSDALAVGHLTDGVVLCVKGGGTAHPHVAKARDALRQSRCRILGVVLNNVPVEAVPYEHRYGLYYGYGSRRGAKPDARGPSVQLRLT